MILCHNDDQFTGNYFLGKKKQVRSYISSFFSITEGLFYLFSNYLYKWFGL